MFWAAFWAKFDLLKKQFSQVLIRIRKPVIIEETTEWILSDFLVPEIRSTIEPSIAVDSSCISLKSTEYGSGTNVNLYLSPIPMDFQKDSRSVEKFSIQLFQKKSAL